MPRNPAYLDAEARVFRSYGLTPTDRWRLRYRP